MTVFPPPPSFLRTEDTTLFLITFIDRNAYIKYRIEATPASADSEAYLERVAARTITH